MSLLQKCIAEQTRASAWVLALSGLLCLAPSASFASTQVSAAPTQKTAKASSPAKVRFIDSSSSESPAARSKRLKKECKGRPNAGMCLGHTR